MDIYCCYYRCRHRRSNRVDDARGQRTQLSIFFQKWLVHSLNAFDDVVIYRCRCRWQCSGCFGVHIKSCTHNYWRMWLCVRELLCLPGRWRCAAVSLLCCAVLVVNVGWTNRKYVHLSFSSMNFRSNNWMIRDSETKCTKTEGTRYTTYIVHRVRLGSWTGCCKRARVLQTNLNVVFIVDYVFIFPLQMPVPDPAPKLLPPLAFVLWCMDLICNRLKCRSLGLLPEWWMQVISMTSFLIYNGILSEMTLTRIDIWH